MNKQQELVARWDNFLFKINQKFEESLQQGEQAVLESLEGNNYDYFSSVRTLSSVKFQIDDSLIKKIDETWGGQVEPAMRADGDYWVNEMFKGNHLNETLQRKLMLWALEVEGKLSQKYYDYAIRLVNKIFRCTQCKSSLEIRKNFFQSQYVTCRYCNTVNTFEPETKYVQIGWNVINNIARLHAIDEYKAMDDASWQSRACDPRKKTPGETPHERYKNAYRKYLEKYFKERSKLLPDTADTYELDIENEMKKIFNY